MNFFEALWAEAQLAYTPWLLLVVTVTFVSRLLARDKLRFRALFLFVAAHLLGLVVTASLAVNASSLTDTVRTPAWVFGGAAFVGSTAALLFSVILPRMRLNTPPIVQDVAVGISMIVAAVGVLSRAGVNLEGLIATSAVFTAVLGLSLQDVIGNIAGGLALQVDGSLEEGDWIRVNDITGRVVEIRWRHTAVETRNWETVLIPNTVMTRSSVKILGRRRGQATQLRRWVNFNVDWRHTPGDVISVVEGAVRASLLDRVAREPEPNCVLMDMAESYGKYALRYWLTDIQFDDGTDSSVRSCVYFALQRAGMSLAMPAAAVFLTEETSDRKAIKTEQQVARRRKLLDTLDLFAALSDAERDELARQLRYAPFASGEVMTRQGAEAHWLYLVEEGQAAVRVSDGSNDRQVAQLLGPCVFGEMSILTGEARSATVIALSDVECFRLDKGAIHRVIQARPELAGQLATLLARRQVELQAAREGLSTDAARERAKREANALVTRIRSFFALE